MIERDNQLDQLVGRIRESSGEGRLCQASELYGPPDPPDQAGAAASPDAGALPAEALLAESAPEDIKFMRGRLDGYYFSALSMTAAYAKHLFRIAERDPMRLIADTVRDESRIYPRPTPLAAFLLQPFSMDQAELDGLVSQILSAAEYADIKCVSASNGERFLYSSEHLKPVHAEALAEWTAVGEKENP
jgi:hypothetical protein